MNSIQMFDPATPDGSNASLSSAVSPDGIPDLGVTYLIPARCGVAVHLSVGQRLRIINTHGTQVCDFWAFHADGMDEHMSMEHMHTDLESIYPKAGVRLITNRRRPILTFEEDSSPGVHDTVIAACDHHRYRQLGCSEYHDNCTDNLRMGLIAIGLRAPAIPAPFNVWMNTPIASNGSVQWLPTVSKPNDYVDFVTQLPCIAVMSACPQDLKPINGAVGEPGSEAKGAPTNLHFVVENL